MSSISVHVELLLGPRVQAPDGRTVGRIGDVRTRPTADDLVVREYRIGHPAIIVRLVAALVGSDLLRVLGVRRRALGWRVRWDQLDLSDPEHPRLTCQIEELERLRV